MSHLAEKHLWSYAAGGMPPKRRGVVRAHVRECDRCRRELSRVIFSQRALRGEGDLVATSSTEKSAWRDELFSRLDAPEPSLAPSRWWMGAAAAGALALVAMVFLPVPRPVEPELVARGGSSEPELKVRALCVVQSEDTARVYNPAREGCPVDSYLKVTAGTSSETRRWVVVWLVDSERVERLYPAEKEPLVEIGSAVAPMHGSFRLDPSWGEPLRLIVIAANSPTLERVMPMLRSARAAADGAYRDADGMAEAHIVTLPRSGK